MKTFHNPENKQVNFLDERFYTVDGETFYPSVTTVLNVYPKGFGFDNWLKELGHNADEVLRRAGTQGTNVHDAVDNIIKGMEITWADENGNQRYTLDEWMMILRFQEFWETYQPELLANEFNLISAEYRLGGTIDLVCMIGGLRWLIDFKTSNGIHTTHELQMAAYAMMFNEKNPEMPIDRTGILWLKANTRGADAKGKKMQGKGWQVIEFPRHYTEAFKLFTYVRAIWDEENPNYKPKNLIYPDRVKVIVKRIGDIQEAPAVAEYPEGVDFVPEDLIPEVAQPEPEPVVLDDSWMK
jgi:hypothetical protein